MTVTPAAAMDPGDTSNHVAFYFSPHEDDWQLFMNPSAFRDVVDGVKVVFIHVTAGDNGLATGNGGRKHPYYLAREHGAELAIRFMADSGDYPAPADAVAAQQIINNGPIRRLSYRNTAAYFLRLPDGNPQGTGYPGTGHQSLARLADAQIGTLTAIDGTRTYRGWSDLVATLRALIEFERGGAGSIHLHVPELEPAVNPDDHSDHRFTAKAALDAAADLGNARIIHHVGYASATRPENLAGYDRDMKCAVYAVTLAGVTAFDHATAWQHYDRMFIARDYCRVEDAPTGPLSRSP